MNSRKNTAFQNQRVWNDFIAHLDVNVFEVGIGEDIADWPKNPDFSCDVFFRLYLPLTGRFLIRTPANELPICPGGLYLIPAFVPLKFMGETPCTHYWIHFVSKSLEQLPNFNIPMKIPLDDPEVSRAEFKRLFPLIENGRTVRQSLEVRHVVENLLAPFLENREDSIVLAEKKHQLFGKVMTQIESRLSEKLETAELARIAGMPLAKFTAEFRRSFGLPPKQYMIQCRLSRAKQLLVRTDLQIKEIAARCGYLDEFFFCRLFTRHMHMPPSRFREAVKHY